MRIIGSTVVGTGTLVAAIGALAVMAFTVNACAKRTPVQEVRADAVTFTDLAVDVKHADDQVYAAGLTQYPKAAHLAFQQKERKVLAASIALDEVAIVLKDGQPVPQTVVDAGGALVLAIDELSKSIPNLSGAERVIAAAVAAIKSAVQQYSRVPVPPTPLPPVQGAEVPPAMLLLALVEGLIQAGVLAFEDVRTLLKSKGVTDDEIQAAIERGRGAIKEIDDEAAKG